MSAFFFCGTHEFSDKNYILSSAWTQKGRHSNRHTVEKNLNRGLCTKDVHPKGGGGVSRKWMKMDIGGGGFWKNGCPLFRTFQNIIVTKI